MHHILAQQFKGRQKGPCVGKSYHTKRYKFSQSDIDGRGSVSFKLK